MYVNIFVLIYLTVSSLLLLLFFLIFSHFLPNFFPDFFNLVQYFSIFPIFFILSLFTAQKKAEREEKNENSEVAAPAVVSASTNLPTPPTNSTPIDTKSTTTNTKSTPSIVNITDLLLLYPSKPTTEPTITYSSSEPPILSQIISKLINTNVKFINSNTFQHLPSYTTNTVTINGDITVSKYLIKVSGASLYGKNDALLVALIDQFIEYYEKIKNNDVKSIEIMLNTSLTSKTYLVGHFLTLADIMFYLLLKNNNYTVLPQTDAGVLPHTNRWFSLVGMWMYICIKIQIYVCVYVYIYIYIYVHYIVLPQTDAGDLPHTNRWFSLVGIYLCSSL
jgi:hypothetical protein